MERSCTKIPAATETEGSDEIDWDKRRKEYFAARQAALEEAYRSEPGAIMLGANAPTDPDLWRTDWRECLPPGDPLRDIGPPIVKAGTPEAFATMAAAVAAVRGAYGLPPEVTHSLSPPNDT